MREYLFHGKRTDNGEWVEGWYVPAGDEGRHCIFLASAPDMGEYVDPKTVGQYIGLKDRRCKRIFEDDILRIVAEIDGVEFVDFGQVIWHENGWCIQIAGCKPERINEHEILPDCEVIGNIHDNPELLEA